MNFTHGTISLKFNCIITLWQTAIWYTITLFYHSYKRTRFGSRLKFSRTHLWWSTFMPVLSLPCHVCIVSWGCSSNSSALNILCSTKDQVGLSLLVILVKRQFIAKNRILKSIYCFVGFLVRLFYLVRCSHVQEVAKFIINIIAWVFHRKKDIHP